MSKKKLQTTIAKTANLWMPSRPNCPIREKKTEKA